MRLRERLSGLVALALAGCGGSTEPERCPYTEVAKRFDVQVTQAQLCAAESEKRILPPNRAEQAVALQTCELCGDPEITACVLSAPIPAEQWAVLQSPGVQADAGSDGASDGGLSTPPSVCPFSEKVGAQPLTCEQRIRRGTRHSGCPIEGRRPAGYVAKTSALRHDENEVSPRRIVATYLSMCADLEAASVVAFEDLRHDLVFHGAPRDMIDDCELAALDEVEHAATVGALAHAYGGAFPIQHVQGDKRPRPLIEIALENASEGSVRELFGAAQALFRAECAQDPSVRDAMKRIADDECRHAELSLRIGAYLDARLDDDEREAVRIATTAARDALREELSSSGETHPHLVRIAGVPTRAAAVALLEAIEQDALLSATPPRAR